MSALPAYPPASTRNSLDHCPVCDSQQFDARTPAPRPDFVTQTCLVCGLTCQVVVGPDSPSAELRAEEWKARFVHD